MTGLVHAFDIADEMWCSFFHGGPAELLRVSVCRSLSFVFTWEGPGNASKSGWAARDVIRKEWKEIADSVTSARPATDFTTERIHHMRSSGSKEGATFGNPTIAVCLCEPRRLERFRTSGVVQIARREHEGTREGQKDPRVDGGVAIVSNL